jgi:hypothetical protein
MPLGLIREKKKPLTRGCISGLPLGTAKEKEKN